jgi:HAD superfamily hydrolase (TIGR01490 family)
VSEVKSYIAFFDLDHTITGEISGNVLAREAYRKGLMSLSNIIYALWLLLIYKLSLRDPVKIINKMTSWVRNVPEELFNNLSAEITKKFLIPAIYNEAIKEIMMHRDNGARTVILSSTPASIGREMAKAIGMDDIICSVLEVDNGLLTGRSVGPLCYREEKAVRMKNYCESMNCSPEDSWYYGDSIADLPALFLVGKPVCVNPEKKLLKKARQNNWKIYYWE